MLLMTYNFNISELRYLKYRIYIDKHQFQAVSGSNSSLTSTALYYDPSTYRHAPYFSRYPQAFM